MFSLWICPDCQRVGEKDFSEHTYTESCTWTPTGERVALSRDVPVVVAHWTCQSCGQIGKTLESSIMDVVQVDAGQFRELRRNRLLTDRRDRPIRIVPYIVLGMLLVLFAEIIGISANLGY